ncbi:MAG: right-handed parallel beta-helix repeat-containing protein, partial [Oscillospiraceae bacterium]|nr:right-handed parallel beta-helix repeat-containing protein [Oscillospiraceae bacterium]
MKKIRPNTTLRWLACLLAAILLTGSLIGLPGGAAPGAADLIFLSIGPTDTPETGGQTKLTAAVVNRSGQSAAAGSTVAFYIDGTLFETVTNPAAIAAGGSFTFTTGASYTVKAGTQTVEAVVSAGGFTNKAMAYITPDPSGGDSGEPADGIPQPGEGGRGADVPYTRYESEDARTGGGAKRYGPTHKQDQTAAEASNQQYTGLAADGDWIEWTVRPGEGGAGVTLRFTLPDSTNGMGNKGSLDLYVNGAKVKTHFYGTQYDNIPLDSYWAWQYFSGDNPGDAPAAGRSPRFRFDEVHFTLDVPLKAGDTVKLQKGNGDAFEYGVDFIEIEPVPAKIEKPAGALSPTDYGTAPGAANSLPAFQQCLREALAQGKTMYIPEGRWNLGGMWDLGAKNITITGAGIWHTNIHFTSSAKAGGGISGETNKGNSALNTASANLEFCHMYISSMLRSRYGQEAIYKCFMDSFGTGSLIHNIWQEHFECGVWIGDYNAPYTITDGLEIRDSRIRNNLADGVNFCMGTKNSSIVNCSVRGNGDDGLAMWNDSTYSAPDTVNNAFLNNTIENNWRAAGIAIFGGNNHRIENNYIKDGFKGPGIRFNTTFPGHKFNNTTNISFKNNTVVSCGTSFNCYNDIQGAIDFFAGPVKNITFENTEIYNSLRGAIQFRQGSFTGISFTNTYVDTIWMDEEMNVPATYPGALSPGCTVILCYDSASGAAVFNGLTVRGVKDDPRLAGLMAKFNTGFSPVYTDFLQSPKGGVTHTITDLTYTDKPRETR